MALGLPWLELLDCISKQAPLAPELAAQIQEQEDRRQKQLKNNKKLPQVAPSEDPVLNDFKREMSFHRQAQTAVLEVIPKLKSLGIKTKRPEDYFAEMAKSDSHMQKIRENLMKKQMQQQRSERVKQIRAQRKEGKAMQVQAKLKRQEEKKQMLDQVKKVRKGLSSDLRFLDDKKKPQGKGKGISRKAMAKRDYKNKKFGFGGKKSGSKLNDRNSTSDFSEWNSDKSKGRKGMKGSKGGKKGNGGGVKRLGKSKRVKSKNKSRK